GRSSAYSTAPIWPGDGIWPTWWTCSPASGAVSASCWRSTGVASTSTPGRSLPKHGYPCHRSGPLRAGPHQTRAGMRAIRPPGWVMDVLKRRHVESVSQWVFPTSTGSLRDPSNTAAQFRKVVAGTPFEGLSPHDFRHYVADALDRAGLS